MQIFRPAVVLVAAFLAVSSELSASVAAQRASTAPSNSAVAAAAARGRLPLAFEVNLGQADSRVRFLARCRGYMAFITPIETVLAFERGIVRMRLAGAEPDTAITALEPMQGKSNYFLGDDPDTWIRGVPHFARVVAKDVYPGVDQHWRGNTGQRLAYDFLVAPGADPGSIVLEFEGANSLEISAAGDLVVAMDDGELRQSRPRLFQDVNGVRRHVAGGFVLRGSRRVGFRVGEYDPSLPLVIDPTISYSTYLGGSSTAATSETGRAIAIDDAGAVYVAGLTISSDFPMSSAYQSNYGGGRDAFISKINAAGSALVYSTFLGGSGGDFADAIAVTGSGLVFVGGMTASTDFPTQSPAYGTLSGVRDAFVAKLNAAGSALVYSTYLGGSGEERVKGIALDDSGAAYLTGRTTSTDFPTQSAIQGSNAGLRDAFVSKLNAAGSALVYSTYLGGSGDDLGTSIAVDGTGAAYVAGATASSDFRTQSPLQTSHGGGTNDVFVAKLNAAGTSLVYSTYLGGSGDEPTTADGPRLAVGLAIDGTGAVYVASITSSANFPTQSPLQSSHGGGTFDACVSKINAAGSALVYSTYIGGTGDDGARAITVDGSGAAYVLGQTASSDFPTTLPVQSAFAGGANDAFVARLNAAGSLLVFSTYLGGSGAEFSTYVAGAIVVDDGAIYVTGPTSSSDFPTTGPIQSSRGGSSDAFVTKYAPDVPPGTPQDLVASVVNEQRVDLTWTDADHLESAFELERAVGDGAFAALVTLDVDTASYSDTAVGGSTAYRYRVRATNSIGPSDWSNVASATTPSPPPTGVAAVSASNRSVTITWSDDCDDETAYVVERAEGRPGEDFVVIAVLPPNTTSYTDRTVRSETTYSYRVRTRGSSADSTPSLEVWVTTGPSDPSSLLAITQSDASVLLLWGDNSAVEAAYEIERAAAGTAAEIVASVPGNTAEYADGTVAAETEYTYRVRAVGEHGLSQWSPRATTRTAPAAPSNPYGEAVSSARLRLTWTDNSAVEKGFEVRRRIHGDEGAFALVERVPPDTTSFIDEGLLQETSYDYTVNAYDNSGDSNPIAIDDLETTAVLVIRKVKLTGAKNRKKPARMSVQAEIDFGGYQPEAADGATIGVNDADFAASTVKARKKGRVLTGALESVAFTLSRRSPTASRGRLKIIVSGAPAEIEDGTELTISFTTGSFTAAGTIVLSEGRFDLKKRVGLRIDPDIIPTKLKLKLGGLENDALQFAATFEPRGVPEEQPRALITVGGSRLVFDGALADVSGGKVTYRLDDVPQATLTIDYDRGTLKLKAKKHELGEYEKGNVKTLLDVVVGALRWRDVPVLRSTGKTATF